MKHLVNLVVLMVTVGGWHPCSVYAAVQELMENSTISSSPLITIPLSPLMTTPSLMMSTPASPWANATTEMVDTTTPSIAQLWEESEARLKKAVNNIIHQLIPVLMENSHQVNISAKCMGDLLQLIGGIRNLKPWAFRMLDATGKIMDGILRGSMYSLGSYDQCIDVEARHKRKKDKIIFRGQYCNVELRPPLPEPKPEFYKLDEVLDEFKEFSQRNTVMAELSKYAQFFYFLSYRFGVCIPSTCTRHDLIGMTASIAKDLDIDIQVPWCEIKKPQEFSAAQIAVVALFSSLGFIALLCTLYHSWKIFMNSPTEGKCQRVILSFSVFENSSRMFNTKETPGIITCLYGIKFLSITWIILGHTYQNIDFVLFRGIYELKNFAKDPAFQAILNSNVAVDSFFFVSGLLVCYGIVRTVKIMNKNFCLWRFLSHRFLRLVPGHMIAIAGVILATLMVKGPVKRDIFDKMHEGCYKNWWLNLLFVNNIVNAKEMCLPHTWYVAADTQMYLFSLIIILPLLKYPAMGLFINFLVMAGSVISTGYATYYYKYPPTMLYVHPDPEQRLELWTNMYYLPYPHLGAYCVGIFIGYLLAVRPKMNINPFVQIVGWGMAIACNIAVLYGVYEWNMGRDPTLTETLIYSGLHRTAWALGLAWVTVICANGYGGIVNDILSWNVLIPLSRMTYMVYLVHPIVQVTFFGNSREELPPSHYTVVWFFFGHLMSSYAVAYGSSMLVESPVLSLERVFRSSCNGSEKSLAITDQKKDEIEIVEKGKMGNGVDGVYIQGNKEINDNKDYGLDNKGFVCRL